MKLRGVASGGSDPGPFAFPRTGHRINILVPCPGAHATTATLGLGWSAPDRATHVTRHGKAALPRTWNYRARRPSNLSRETVFCVRKVTATMGRFVCRRRWSSSTLAPTFRRSCNRPSTSQQVVGRAMIVVPGVGPLDGHAPEL